ncbi:MAG TPA: hypothetical protein VH208_07360 [Myxococcaceae bacterium]|jgi:hypothetical protein|nr:hypothetical protein [Myxococcaceae bacterium]
MRGLGVLAVVLVVLMAAGIVSFGEVIGAIHAIADAVARGTR